MRRSESRTASLRTVLAAGLALGLAIANPVLAAITDQSWEIASEFDHQSNPAGVWTYGWKPTHTGAFSPMTHAVNAYSGKIRGWDTPASVTHNVGVAPFVAPFGGGPVNFRPHALAQHPGPGCEISVIRFTAPLAGSYRIDGQYFGMDPNGNSTITDVQIRHNANQLWNGAIDVGAGPQVQNFVRNVNGVQVGDTFDFQVGCGANQNYNFDTTGLNAVIVFTSNG